MPGSPVHKVPSDTIPGGETRAQQIAYYANYLKRLPGTYQGTQKAYVGETWSQLYVKLAAKDSRFDPAELAAGIEQIYAAQRIGKNVAAVEKETLIFGDITEKAAASTNFNPLPNPLAGLLAPLAELAAVFHAVFQQVTKASMWRSLGWIVLGGVLLIAGIVWWAKNEAGGIAKSVVKNAL